MKSYLIVIGIIVLATKFNYAQSDPTSNSTAVMSSDWNERGLTLGIQYWNYLYGEVGYYRSFVFEAGGYPIFSSTINYGVEYSYVDNLILAPKVQGRLHVWFFNGSISGLYYSNLKDKSAIKIRPELGIGLWNFDLSYGYNIGIYKNGFERSNKSTFSFRTYIKLKRIHLNEYDREGNKVVR